MNKPHADWDKLARHLAGEANASESAEAQRWLEANPAEAKALKSLDAAVRRLPSDRVDVERALAKTKTRLHARSRSRYVAWAIAATVVAAAGTLYVTSPRVPDLPIPRDVASYSTGVGQRDSVVLSDGSTVILGPASRVDVRDRDVTLTGEAYFRIVHNERLPFTVRAGGAVIRDLGTEFSVHSDSASDVRVVVHEGSVRLSRARDSVVLAPGDVGVATSARVGASRGAATEDDFAWTKGRLVFRDAPVAEIAADLRRWYGVELRVSDSALLRRHFTGSFVGEPSTRVVEVIALALGARLDRRGDLVILTTATRPR